MNSMELWKSIKEENKIYEKKTDVCLGLEFSLGLYPFETKKV